MRDVGRVPPRSAPSLLVGGRHEDSVGGSGSGVLGASGARAGPSLAIARTGSRIVTSAMECSCVTRLTSCNPSGRLRQATDRCSSPGTGMRACSSGRYPTAIGKAPPRIRSRSLRDSYADYQVTYRKVSGSWFALSGEGNGKTFYEKVIFSCNGRLINSFAMIYPTAAVGAVRPRCRRHREVLPGRDGDLPACWRRACPPTVAAGRARSVRSACRQHRPV